MRESVVAATVGSKRMFGNSSVRLKKRYGGSRISPDTKPDEPDSRLLLIEHSNKSKPERVQAEGKAHNKFLVKAQMSRRAIAIRADRWQFDRSQPVARSPAL